jgi:hypothetical protein
MSDDPDYTLAHLAEWHRQRGEHEIADSIRSACRAWGMSSASIPTTPPTTPPDDALDGKLGGEVKPPARGSMADLTARARHAGFPTLAAYVDNLEDIVARYEGRRGMEGSVLVDPAGRAHWLPEYEPPSARAEPLRSDRPLLRGVDDLREERDQ